MTITRNMDDDVHKLVQENPNIREKNKIIGSFFHGNIFILTNDNDEEEEYCNYNSNMNENPSNYEEYDDDNDERRGGGGEIIEPEGIMERAMFWESQEALLQEILEQYSSNGSKLRDGIIRNVERARDSSCECSNPKLGGCAKCLRRRVVHQLCEKGFSANLCTSKWKHTSKMPGGRHEYIEVMASTQGRKKKIPFLIELEFRDEFKMAKACKEYLKMIGQLPEIFVGKSEHLNAIIRLMCDAAKRSTTQQKIHLGPWRKRNFMQMKWSASTSTTSSERRLVNTVDHQITLSKLRLNISPRQDIGMLSDVRSGLDQFAAGTAVQVA